MDKTSISVTEAARNFSDCINRVHYQRMIFVLHKNGAPMARIVPDDERVCTGRDLATALAKVDLTEREAMDWQRDRQTASRILKAPVDRWR